MQAGPVIFTGPVFIGKKTGQQSPAGRRAYRGIAEEIIQDSAIMTDGINIRGFNQFAAVTAEGPAGLHVGVDDQYVWFRHNRSLKSPVLSQVSQITDRTAGTELELSVPSITGLTGFRLNSFIIKSNYNIIQSIWLILSKNFVPQCVCVITGKSLMELDGLIEFAFDDFIRADNSPFRADLDFGDILGLAFFLHLPENFRIKEEHCILIFLQAAFKAFLDLLGRPYLIRDPEGFDRAPGKKDAADPDLVFT